MMRSEDSPIPAQVPHSPEDLQQLYRKRFEGVAEYRAQFWQVLVDFFKKWIPTDGTVLDLGCGYCEFINNIRAGRKFGMDLNPDSATMSRGATIFQHDCSTHWPLEANSLDTVFTSNFFEHLPTKASLESTLQQAFRCLKPGGRLIAMGPNIRHLPGSYWDFFDHYVALTERSLTEVCSKVGFRTEYVTDKFMPYTAVNQPRYPMIFIKAYLALPLAWKLFGKQFLVIVQRPEA